MEKNETLMLAIVFVAVFALAFSFNAWLTSQNSQLYGFKIFSSKPSLQAIREVLARDFLILRQELKPGKTRENSAVAAASAEFIYAAQLTGKPVYNYGVVNGEFVNSSCNANNSFCGAPDVTVAIDDSKEPCNCIKVFDNNTLYILGSADFFLSNAANVRNIVYAAQAGGVNTTSDVN